MTQQGPDLLIGGSERGPWLSPRRRRQGLAICLAVLSLGLLTDRVHADRLADRSAVQALALRADSPAKQDVVPEGQVRIGLRNAGPDPVRLLSARLPAPGYGETSGIWLLRPGSVVNLSFTDAARCGRQLLSAPVDTVSVRLLTHRGTLTTRDVPLSPGAFREVNYPAHERCGFLPMGQSLSFQVRSVRPVEQGVLVTTDVANRSLLPLRLVRIAPSPGLAVRVTPQLSLELPVKASVASVVVQVRLMLRLTVTDCDTLAATDRVDRSATIEQLLRVWIIRGSSIFELPVPHASATGGKLFDLLLRSCG